MYSHGRPSVLGREIPKVRLLRTYSACPSDNAQLCRPKGQRTDATQLQRPIHRSATPALCQARSSNLPSVARVKVSSGHTPNGVGVAANICASGGESRPRDVMSAILHLAGGTPSRRLQGQSARRPPTARRPRPRCSSSGPYNVASLILLTTRYTSTCRPQCQVACRLSTDGARAPTAQPRGQATW